MLIEVYYPVIDYTNFIQIIMFNAFKSYNKM